MATPTTPTTPNQDELNPSRREWGPFLLTQDPGLPDSSYPRRVPEYIEVYQPEDFRDLRC